MRLTAVVIFSVIVAVVASLAVCGIDDPLHIWIYVTEEISVWFRTHISP